MEQEQAKQNPIQVAGRLFGALEYLAEAGASPLADVAEHLELNKSTTHRVLASLQFMGYVRQDAATGRYEDTFRLVDLAEKVTAKADVIRTVRPVLEQLMMKTGETIHFVRLEDADIVYIDKVESDRNNVRMVSRIGSRIPFYRSAVGKALAAEMTADEVRRLWDQCTIERKTPYTITNFEDFQESLEEIRRKGYALDNEENETGVRCIGASLSISDRPEYAFSISVPITRMDNDRIRDLSGDVLRARETINSLFRSE